MSGRYIKLSAAELLPSHISSATNMRLPIVFVSTAFVLAGMSATLAVERENMLVARYVDFDSLGEVEARAYDEEPELYARGGVLSKTLRGRNRNSRPTSYRSASAAGNSLITLLSLSRMASRQTDYSGSSLIAHFSNSRTVSRQTDSSGTTLVSFPSHPPLFRTGSGYSGTTSASSHTSRSRRSL